MRALVTGATGFIGGGLAHWLGARGHEVRCLVRDRGRAQDLEQAGFELHEGDVLDAATLRGAGEGVDVAYYLVHSMGRGGDRGGFAEREQQAASELRAHGALRGRRARRVPRRARGASGRSTCAAARETARVLAAEGPPLTYMRAAMVIGAGSESYKMVRYLVERLPAMIAPAWLRNRTQPIAVDDVLEYLAQAGERPEPVLGEVQIGGADVLTYGELLDLMAEVLGKRRRPRLPVPLLTPKLSSLWIGLVTPVDAGVAQPLIESLASDTDVTDPGPASLFDVRPMGSAEALRRARAEETAGRA